jgi:hypothetical protein
MKMMTCEYCEKEKLCEYAPDPYNSEINEDHTKVWMCSECRYDRYMDT